MPQIVTLPENVFVEEKKKLKGTFRVWRPSGATAPLFLKRSVAQRSETSRLTDDSIASAPTRDSIVRTWDGN